MRTQPFTAVKQRPDPTAVPGYLDFSVSVAVADGAALVRLTGDLDCYTSPRLRSALLTLVGDGVRQVTLDMAGSKFIDSTGLSVLVGGLKRLREQGGSLVLREPSPEILRIFEITGLHAVFNVA